MFIKLILKIEGNQEKKPNLYKFSGWEITKIVKKLKSIEYIFQGKTFSCKYGM